MTSPQETIRLTYESAEGVAFVHDADAVDVTETLRDAQSALKRRVYQADRYDEVSVVDLEHVAHMLLRLTKAARDNAKPDPRVG